MRSISRAKTGLGVIVILGIGLIHVVLAAGEFAEAAYLCLMFVACGAASVVAAFGIYRGARLWGWGLGLLLAVGAFVGYILSRTVGLPGMEVEEWLLPAGILSLVLEMIFIGLYGWTRIEQPRITGSPS